MPPKFKFTRAEIIECAFNLVRQKGWSNLSTRTLADELGTSSRPIYSFFKSINELEEELVKKAVDLLYDYMTRKRTNDPWHDHGVGYVMFAKKEKHLFIGCNSEKNIEYFKKYGDIIWYKLTASLFNYPPFKGLSEEQIYQIQATRWLLAHGLAFQVSNPPTGIWNDEKITLMISQGSTAIISGLKLQFEKEQKNTSKKEEDKMAAIDPRKMALQIAGLRANETHLPADERVFEDPYAEYFFSADIRKMFQDVKVVKAELAKYEQMMPGVNGAIVARIRFIDEYLVECISNDFKQLVIIGAGYDTRAYRIYGVKENLKVFEVDHPVTQEAKVEKIKEIFNQLPDHITYVPVVFGQDRLDQKISENGYQPGIKTLFIVEGLLMYIPPPAVDALLSFFTITSGPESAVVADFFDTTVVDGTSSLIEAQVLRNFVESEGSSLQFGIEKGKFEEFFTQRGFRHVTIVNAASCKKDYFKGESTNRTVSAMFNFVKAAI